MASRTSWNGSDVTQAAMLTTAVTAMSSQLAQGQRSIGTSTLYGSNIRSHSLHTAEGFNEPLHIVRAMSGGQADAQTCRSLGDRRRPDRRHQQALLEQLLGPGHGLLRAAGDQR